MNVPWRHPTIPSSSMVYNSILLWTWSMVQSTWRFFSSFIGKNVHTLSFYSQASHLPFQPESKLLRILGTRFRTLALNTRKQSYLKDMQKEQDKDQAQMHWIPVWAAFCLSTSFLSFFFALILFCLHLCIHVLHWFYGEQVSHLHESSFLSLKTMASQSQGEYLSVELIHCPRQSQEN